MGKPAAPEASASRPRGIHPAGPGRLRLPLLLLLLAGLVAGGMLAGASPGSAAGESEIKAAMLFNFTKFIDWPAGRTEGALVMGVAGDDGVREALEELAKGRAGGRPVQVRRVEQPAEADACHLLYLGRGVRKRHADFLTPPRRGVVMTGDGEGFTKGGGTIGFIVVENKLRFEVNLAAANQAGVTVSSRLLRLAMGVKP